MIRPATRADINAIARLWEKLVAYHQRLNPDLPKATPDGGQLYAQRLLERMDNGQTSILVAEDEGQVIGFVLGVVVDLVPDMFMQEICGFLADIFVEAEYRGRGVGRALVGALTDWFRSQGLDYFEWYVAAHNIEGRRFWRAMGGHELMIRMRADL
jgi:GNAT superfamily N-acetyltransferase